MFGWGRNDQGQLGLGGGLTMDVYAAEVLPRSIEALAGEKVLDRALNDTLLLLLVLLSLLLMQV